jgi:hypothetical protein
MKRLSLVAVAVAGLAGCTAGHATQNNAPVNLFIVGIGPSPLTSDVSDAGVVTADIVIVTVVNRSKNPGVLVPQIPLAIIMERYEVVYTRSDGRNVPGVDVPYAISGPLNGALDAATSGESLDLPVEVVRIQQKLEPPLRNLRGPQVDTLGGTAIAMTVVAEVTVYGRTTVGQVVSDSAQLQIDFADFG